MSTYRNEDNTWSVYDDNTGRVLIVLPDEQTAWEWMGARQ